MSDDFWAGLIQSCKRMIEARRETYKNLVENASHISATRVIEAEMKQAGYDIPAELLALWREGDNLDRQIKALWLRAILEDFEY